MERSKTSLASFPVTERAPGGRDCASCRAFAMTPGGGECRLKSPLGILIPGPGGQPAVVGFWPSTRPDQWCLEFQYHEQEPDPRPVS